ncbi:VRR-NUC domain-containing protein [Rhizobium pusense]|uniref:VRR-NUC domain-containing protein n=1 Tax=Agrobacterium pusense TaxID=648995 RepID=A0A6H0ZNS2_9HYPH|nr:VRR-NUC domain-containing protein [Agrobacterium pusense]MDH2091108.1 VRR-NUC domain-containing protein [Agrobacterium pusense]QIX21430.1 VRR-NUC domain-containing protein [Agrobacterium pusense]
MTRNKKNTSQTTRINGKRVVIRTSAAGKVTVKEAPVLEWQLQAAAVRALKALPNYAKDAETVTANSKAGIPSFTMAADMNGDYRSGNAAVKAEATGIAAGDPDLRIYLPNGVLRLIEYKGKLGRLTDSQKERHPLLEALGHPVLTVKVSTTDEAAEKSVALVKSWLLEAANDNQPQ